MRLSTTAFRLSKAGNRANEIEDALFPASNGRWTDRSKRFVVCDGASEALLSGVWAEVLARTYGRSLGDSPTLLALAQSRWRRWLRRYLWRRARDGRPVQWFEEPGLEAGAYASLLGVTLCSGDRSGSGRWTATALGDSCVFQVRSGVMLMGFPMARAADFSSRPFLVGSRATGNQRVLDALTMVDGVWQTGDRLYLMTDALAHWWLVQYERGRAPWRSLDRLCSPGQAGSFAQWIDARRQRHQIRNDDVALLRVACLPEY